ncbi:DUF1858 domain-containing protein [Enterococcus sp. UD-01]|jgi:hypothetical protein|uniref:DUF1858 domain-containing protein n=1 Tax=Enterococcus sp. UD-01 TaxID=3373911 RepID=UPI00383428DB
MQEINVNQSVYQMVTTFPETKKIMYDLGFKSIIEPGMLNTAGRYMTLAKGAKLKKIPINTIEQAFTEKGFVLKGDWL